MKHTKRIRKRKSSANPTLVAKEDKEQKVIRALMDVFSLVSLNDAIYAYREADGDANKAAKILELAVTETESSKESFTSSTTSGGSDAGSSSGSGSGSGSSKGFELSCIQNLLNEKGFRGKQKRVVAAAGTISTVLGKEYVSSIPRPTLLEMSKWKGFGNGGAIGKEEAEQFLCCMLGLILRYIV